MEIFAEIRRIPSFVKESFKEFKSPFSITFGAMMTAMNVLIGAFRINISNILVISFSSVTIGPCALACGPILTATICAIADILKYLLSPNGPFFIGFTINEFLLGLIYGLYFYRKKVSVKRVLAARITIVILLNLMLTPLWLQIMYGNSFWVLVSARIVKNIVLLPVDTALLYFFMKTAERVLSNKLKKA